jgi:mono/diheme cytochrome c family protein
MEGKNAMKKTWFFISSVLLLGALALSACGGGAVATTTQSQGTPVPTPPSQYAGKTNPMAGDQSAADAGKQIFETNCTSCHGADAKGDGPAAASLSPKPADLADLESGFSDSYMFWRISEGGAMPPFNSQMPTWKSTLSEDQIWQVITYLRTFSKQ